MMLFKKHLNDIAEIDDFISKCKKENIDEVRYQFKGKRFEKVLYIGLKKGRLATPLFKFNSQNYRAVNQKLKEIKDFRGAYNLSW